MVLIILAYQDHYTSFPPVPSILSLIEKRNLASLNTTASDKAAKNNLHRYMQSATFVVAAHSTVDTPCGSRKLDEEQGIETIVTESPEAHHPR